ncbi:hypothetical protein BGZ60DRAFT_396504 [Tricladium varicosporioides]|nr:hypothetical protein BGZ60DRAFT_396504 [Hymenoscyphus varicosporioides]
MTSPNDVPALVPPAMNDNDNDQSPELDFTAADKAEDGQMQADENQLNPTNITSTDNINESAAELDGQEQSEDAILGGPTAFNPATTEGDGEENAAHPAAQPQPLAEAAVPLPIEELQHPDLQMNNGAWATAMEAMALYDSSSMMPFSQPPGMMALQMAMNGHTALQQAMGLQQLPEEPPLESLDASEDYQEPGLRTISAYAKLKFLDGVFYMNTHNAILGRDTKGHKNAQRREQEQKLLEQNGSSAGDPRTPVQVGKDHSRFTRSIVSESGGILRDGDDSDDDEERRLRRKHRSARASRKSKSTGSSQHGSRRNSLAQPNGLIIYEAQLPARRTDQENAAVVDPDTLRPSPHDCPIVPIHPGAAAPAVAYKAISRQHLKIKYSGTRNRWEALVLGRNGAFLNGEFHPFESIMPLEDGSELQVGGVPVVFELPKRPDDAVSQDRYSEGGKEMSFDFEDEPRDGVMEDTSEGRSDEDNNSMNDRDEGRGEGESSDEREEEEEEGEDNEQEGDDEISNHSPLQERIEHTHAFLDVNDVNQQPDPTPMLPKKRGPGRPPKNGIMSKREQQLAKKEALAREREKEGEKANKTMPAPPPVPGKNKVGRPRKHPRPDTPPEPREKRKYTKRKPKEPKAGEGEANPDGDGENKVTKEKKEKKEVKPPRSPSPEMRESDYTEEQMIKPSANYVQLIHEAIGESKEGKLSLPFIYKAIGRKYPYFVFRSPTIGWQSSVRHNLSQHHAFQKVQRDGKGWLWALVPGVSVEKDKKKKASPPPQPQGQTHHQPIYQAGHPPGLMPSNSYTPGIMGPPPGYPHNPQHYPMAPHLQPGQTPYQGPPPNMNPHQPPQGPQQGLQQGSQQGPPHIIPGQPPPGFLAPAIPLQLSGSRGPTYSSPYASKPASNLPPQPQPQSQPHPQSQPPPPQQQQNNQSPATEHKPIPQPPPPAIPGQASSAMSQQPLPGPTPQSNPKVLEAVNKFRDTLKTSMASVVNGEAIMESAINRVLGKTNQSTANNHPHEELIIGAITQVLKGMGIKLDENPAPASDSIAHTQGKQAPSPPTNNDKVTSDTSQTSMGITSSPKAGPTVTRPVFTGQDQIRSGGSSVPRPPMTTPGMKRSNSDSPANASCQPRVPSSASPAPPHTPSSANGANTPQPTTNETGQLAGQKRERMHDDTDDIPEMKRINTGPAQVKA